MFPAIVTLSRQEVAHAAHAGMLRAVDCVFNGQTPYYTPEGSVFCWHGNVQGALAEYAVSKALNQRWPGPGRLSSADVGEWIEVRSTTYRKGSLTVRSKDADHMAVVLVTGDGRSERPLSSNRSELFTPQGYVEFTLQGWMWAAHAKQAQYWNDHDKLFLVPQEQLWKYPIPVEGR
jgi:hypothetical protein